MAKLNADNIVGEMIKDIQADHIEANVDIDLLVSFKDHPFKIYDDKKMQEMIESIQANGVINPLIVRKQGYNNYEIISGHNRWQASKKIGLTKLPVIIKNVDDDTARIIMVDSNLNQRADILPSEKAFAYKMKMNALNKQGKRNDLTSCHSGTKLSAEEISKENKDSPRKIFRYIRLTELIPSLLDKVDNNELGFIPAVDLSYLSKEEQSYVQEVMELATVKPTKVQADLLKKKSQESGLTHEDIKAILVEEKKTKLSGMSATKLKSYFPKEIAKDLTDERMNKIMQEMVSDWLSKQK